MSNKFCIDTLLDSIIPNEWFRVYQLPISYSVTDVNIRLRKIKQFRERKVKGETRSFTEFYISTDDLFLIKLESEKYQKTTPVKLNDLPIRKTRSDKLLDKVMRC